MVWGYTMWDPLVLAGRGMSDKLRCWVLSRKFNLPDSICKQPVLDSCVLQEAEGACHGRLPWRHLNSPKNLPLSLSVNVHKALEQRMMVYGIKLA